MASSESPSRLPKPVAKENVDRCIAAIDEPPNFWGKGATTAVAVFGQWKGARMNSAGRSQQARRRPPSDAQGKSRRRYVHFILWAWPFWCSSCAGQAFALMGDGSMIEYPVCLHSYSKLARTSARSSGVLGS